MKDNAHSGSGPLIVCGIAGSLRRDSYNRALLRAAGELLPQGTELRIFDEIAQIPLFNQDVEAQGDPEAVFGASPGITGTARAQSQLRQTLDSVGAPVLPQPQILVYRAREKFDDQGQLTHERTREFVGRLLQGLAEWTRRVAGDIGEGPSNAST